MEIRCFTEADIPRVLEIYDYARGFMAAHGNPNQWGPTRWPPETLIRADAANGSGYVCVEDGGIVGAFAYFYGRDVEPNYAVIEDGAWRDGSPYGVVHRLAGDGSARGVGAFCLDWAYRQCGHLRVDTHADNAVMRNLLRSLGFAYCGTIHVPEDDYPRLAFEKSPLIR